MKNKRNVVLLLFLLISLINTALFFSRDKFMYHKNGTYSSLYESDPLKWKQFVYDYPADELGQTKKLLDSSIDMHGKTTVQKVLAIGRLLYNRFYKRIGTPSTGILTYASPLHQYQILCASDSEKLLCGHFGNMFAFFCWSEGIPCRYIEIMNPGDHHVLNECYLAEKKQWVVVDLTFNRLLIRSSANGRYLNFFDILNPSEKNVVNIQTIDDSIIATPFNLSFYDHFLSKDPLILYYYRVNNSAVYETSEKIKRYLLPVSWYEEVNGHNSNFLFYMKEFFVFLWFVYFAVLIRIVVFK